MQLQEVFLACDYEYIKPIGEEMLTCYPVGLAFAPRNHKRSCRTAPYGKGECNPKWK